MIAGILAGFMKTSSGGGGGGGGTPTPPPTGTLAVSIDDREIIVTGLGVQTLTASYSLNSNGKAYNQGGSILENWLDSGAASNCQVRATLQSGTADTGTYGIWQNLSTTRTWGRSALAGQDTFCNILIEIRNSSTNVVLDNAIISLAVNNTNTGGGGGGIQP